MNLFELIKNYKPNIKESSITSYVQTIETIINHFKDEKFYKNYDNTMNYILKFKITTIKNKLNVIVILLNALKEDEELIKKYSDELKKYSLEYNDFLTLHKKTNAQELNWIEYNDLLKVSDDLIKQFNKITKQDTITKEEYKTLLFTIMIITHVYIPLRNDLYSIIKLSDDEYNKLEVKDQNYLINNKLIMNNYKTNKHYGQLIFTIPRRIMNLYNKFFKFNTSKYLITSIKDRNKPINSNTYTKYFNMLFSKYYPLKKISSSLIRHIIASHDLKDSPTITEKKEIKNNTIKKFQHSETMNNIYRKL